MSTATQQRLPFNVMSYDIPNLAVFETQILGECTGIALFQHRNVKFSAHVLFSLDRFIDFRGFKNKKTHYKMEREFKYNDK